MADGSLMTLAERATSRVRYLTYILILFLIFASHRLIVESIGSDARKLHELQKAIDVDNERLQSLDESEKYLHVILSATTPEALKHNLESNIDSCRTARAIWKKKLKRHKERYDKLLETIGKKKTQIPFPGSQMTSQEVPVVLSLVFPFMLFLIRSTIVYLRFVIKRYLDDVNSWTPVKDLKLFDAQLREITPLVDKYAVVRAWMVYGAPWLVLGMFVFRAGANYLPIYSEPQVSVIVTILRMVSEQQLWVLAVAGLLSAWYGTWCVYELKVFHEQLDDLNQIIIERQEQNHIW